MENIPPSEEHAPVTDDTTKELSSPSNDVIDAALPALTGLSSEVVSRRHHNGNVSAIPVRGRRDWSSFAVKPLPRPNTPEVIEG